MSDEETTRLRALASGRGQGVFFREFARSHALRLGLVGWVRNLPGGKTVELIAEGPRTSLQELVSQLRNGPPGAQVENVDVGWDTARLEFRSFQVR